MKVSASHRAQRSRGRARLVLALRLFVSGSLLLLLFSRIPVQDVFERLSGATQEPFWLLMAAGLAGVGVALAVGRWRTLIGSAGEAVGFWTLFRAFLVGNFFNQFFPSTIGGDVARSWWIRTHLGSMTRSVAIVTFDRILGIAGICLVGLAAVLVRPDVLIVLPELKIAAGLLLATLVALYLVVCPGFAHAVGAVLPTALRGRTQDKLSEIAAVSRMLRANWRRLAVALLLSVLLQGILILYFAALGEVLELGLTIAQFSVLIPVMNLCTALPISINGIGIREASLALFGAAFGLTVGQAVALAWLFLCVAALYGLLGGLIFALGRRGQEPTVADKPGTWGREA